MIKEKIQHLEKISDYSIDLMKEILSDIAKLSQYSWQQAHNKLDSINKKIDLARSEWVNVDELDKQVLDFRVIIFNRDITNKIEEIESHSNRHSFDISRIESEYQELKKEKNIDHSLLEIEMKKLSNELARANLKYMIRDITEWGGTSTYSIDHVAHKLEILKEEWIYVDDIEEMLFG